MRRLPVFRTHALSVLAAALLGACASTPPEDSDAEALLASAWAQNVHIVGAEGVGVWAHMRYGNHKPTRYIPTLHQGRPAILARSDAGNSTLRMNLAPQDLGTAHRLSFSWFVPALNERADLRDADIDDAVARVILTFDGDRGRMTPRDHMLSEIAHLVTGEPLPFATLMYVWDHRYPVGSVIPNPHTQRIRKLVVESGPQHLNQWVDLERDIETDYRLVFGEAPGRLTGIGVMSDSNNTGENVQAWFGPLTLGPGPGDRAQPLRAAADLGRPVGLLEGR
jgi:hypothetical protein